MASNSPRSGRRSAPARPQSTGLPRRLLESAVICLAVVLVYSNTFSVPFILDDINSIVENPNIRSLTPISRAWNAPDQSTVAGRPVPALSLAVNYALSGLNPWSYHLINIMIHCLAALLLLGILRRTPTGWSTETTPGDSPGNQFRAAAIALIWALHPLHTEVVTVVSTRTESLMALFVLASIYCLIRSAGPNRAFPWLTAGIVACALAMGSKETAVALPIILLLFDRVFLSPDWRAVFRHRGMFHTAAAATWICLGYLVAQGARSASAGLFFSSITPLDYLRTQSGVILHYLRLAVWPHPLVLDYFDWPVAHAFSAPVAALLVLFSGLAAAALVSTIRGSRTGFAGIWFFAILAPTSSVLPIVTEIAAERRMYLPLIAVITLLAAALHRGIHTAFNRRSAASAGVPTPAWIRTAWGTGLVLIAAALGNATYQRNTVYVSEESIWRDTVHQRPNNCRAHANLGTAYLRRGKTSEAVAQFKKALQLDPSVAGVVSGNTVAELPANATLQVSSRKSLENWGLALLNSGDAAEAARLLEISARYAPADAVTRVNLAQAYVRLGRTGPAMDALKTAVDLAPESAPAHRYYARLLADAGQMAQAVMHIQRAAGLEPRDPDILQEAGRICLLAGEWSDAEHFFTEASTLSGETIPGQLGRAAARLNAGDMDAANGILSRIVDACGSELELIRIARQTFDRLDRGTAVRLLDRAVEGKYSNSSDMRMARGQLLAAAGRDAAARDDYLAALRLRPGWGDAGNSLAVLYAVSMDPSVRNAAKSLEIAAGLSSAAGDRHPVLLATLALAQAASGDRDTALSSMDAAIRLAAGANQDGLIQELTAQRDRIQAGWPEPVQPPTSPDE